MSDPRVSSLMWRQCVCGEWYWGAPQEGASDPARELRAWRTKTSIRDGSSTGRFVVDWDEAEEALDAARSEAATEARRELRQWAANEVTRAGAAEQYEPEQRAYHEGWGAAMHALHRRLIEESSRV